MSTDLPESLLQFVRACIPTYQAAEVLLFLAANPDRDFSPAEVVESMRPIVVTGSAIAEYAAHFAAKGLLTEHDNRYRYNPSPEFERNIAELAHAYNHRPVTLIAAIYRITDSKIRSFADAFKLRKDEP
jgi:hypothetical protein